MNTDIINGLFEFGGCIFLFLNCLKIYRDKCFRGVSPIPFVFYTLWGYWNLVYYPSLGQYWSFYGGMGVVGVNTLYCYQLWHYRKN